MERILEQTSAQAVNVRDDRVARAVPLRPVEQCVRNLRGTRARMRERAEVKQLRVVRTYGDCRVKRIAGVPRRTAIEMRADVVDERRQDACASAICSRMRRTLIRLRICEGSASIRDAACLSSADFCEDPASADP